MPLKKPRATRNTNVNKTKIFLKEGFDSSLPKAFLWGSKCCLGLAEHVFPFLITNMSFFSKQSKISSRLPHPLFISLLVQNSVLLWSVLVTRMGAPKEAVGWSVSLPYS